MLKVIALIALFLHWGLQSGFAEDRVHKHGLEICSTIVQELTEGKVSDDEAREIALAIATAGNKHFGRTTCGDMWLYMAIAYVESGFRTNIVNYYNCRGMFQVHAPSWANKFGITYADLLDVDTNAHCGVGIFRYYLALYKRVSPALSAYNSDNPHAATRYASAVLNIKRKIKKRYSELYNELEERDKLAAESQKIRVTAYALPKNLPPASLCPLPESGLSPNLR